MSAERDPIEVLATRSETLAETLAETLSKTTIEPDSGPLALPAPVVPDSAQGKSLAETDPELYAAWRHHIEQGFENNSIMFKRVLAGFMNPYWLTVAMYGLLFAIGLGAFLVGALLSFQSGKEMFGLLFGGLGVVSLLTYFVSRPLQALEENIQFITWLGIIYNTYWTRLLYTSDPATVHEQIEDATQDAIQKIKELTAAHTARSGSRPGLR